MVHPIIFVLIVIAGGIAIRYVRKRRRKSNHYVDIAPVLYIIIAVICIVLYLLYLVGHFAGWWA